MNRSRSERLRRAATIALAGLGASAQAQLAPEPAASSNLEVPLEGVFPPRIQFASPVHDFGRVIAGTLLKHDFIFTNTGLATLLITGVKATCGCTTAGEWTREVEPGQTGSVPLQYQSPKLDLATFKEATVSCNDPSQPTVRLELRATLGRPVAVDPELTVLTVTNDDLAAASSVVRIINQEPGPLVPAAPVSDNRLFRAELKTNQPGREFELRIRAVPPLGQSPLSGLFKIRTSSQNLPELRVKAHLQRLTSPASPPVQDTPPQGLQPPGPNAPAR